jgi:hypothetical protein
MGLTDDQRQETEDVAELAVRRYFDTYLTDTFPIQMAAIREHAHTQIEQHDGNRKAHGAAEAKVNRLVWGIAAVTGIAGVAATVKSLFF